MTSLPLRRAPSRFVELSENECIKLLAEQTVGRIGFMTPDGPQILPVSYQYRFGSVIFRTSPAGALAGLTQRTSVAFEVDKVDERGRSGWSVLVLGFAEAMVHNYLLASTWETSPVPWADGTRNLFIEIKPRKISGRSVHAPTVY
jgi:uncharacterized protein